MEHESFRHLFFIEPRKGTESRTLPKCRISRLWERVLQASLREIAFGTGCNTSGKWDIETTYLIGKIRYYAILEIYQTLWRVMPALSTSYCETRWYQLLCSSSECSSDELGICRSRSQNLVLLMYMDACEKGFCYF